MSSTEVPSREVARRVFATEFNDATFTFKESDDERAPVYQLLPTGQKANRVFFSGTLTEKEDVGEDNEYWRGRIVDPTGTFFVYAGQYQPEAARMLRELEPPAYVSVAGKPRTFETDDGSKTASVRPESIAVVDDSTRNRWVVETAERTLDRIERFDEESNEYARTAEENYEIEPRRYTEAVVSAIESLEETTDTAGSDAIGTT
ncbi:MAG: uncharacterized protein conserved in archaea [Haloquadratum sp. J07HQX50]|jgi:Uncharacterized protein conserved in archaea|nr:MAG: uncharacterized protein conserved in archaea [Haloquadratum sp. J07HQX50]